MNNEIALYLLNNLKIMTLDVGIQQRGIGDMIEYSVCKLMQEKYQSYVPAASKRTMEDFQLVEGDVTYKYDVKTHNVNAEFSMPNLVSVKRLLKYMQEPTNNLGYIFVTYEIVQSVLKVLNVSVFQIEQMDWSCLHIQNLGKGQLQLKNSSKIRFTQDEREVWVDMLKENMVAHYYKQINGMQKEIDMLEDTMTEHCPECNAKLRCPIGGGVQCTNDDCGYWFCY